MPSMWNYHILYIPDLDFSVSIQLLFDVLLKENCQITLILIISNEDQASTLKIAYIFKFFGFQSCLMVDLWFEQVAYVCDEFNNFQDSKLIFMISDFKTFPIMLSGQLNCGLMSVSQLFYVYFKGKNPLFFNLQFLLLNEKG